MPTDTYQAHDAANIFPLDEEHIDELAADIKAHGLQVPVEMIGEKIIDGRRRWLACERAEVKPEKVQVNPDDPVAYVLSLNLHRRHLSESQRAMIGARAREQYEKAAKERKTGRPKKSASPDAHISDLPRQPGDRGRASTQAGKAVGVSPASIDRARHVLDSGKPELINAVDTGEMSVAKASRVARGVDDDIKPVDELPEGVSRGMGVARANEAIDCLKRIPKNDRLRKRGFQIVTDWIRHNK